jgi:spore germination protein YaaH
MYRSLHLVSALVLVLGSLAVTYDGVLAATPAAEVQARQSGSATTQPAQSLNAAPADQSIRQVSTRLSKEVFGFALASSLSDPTVGYPSWNFSLLTTVAFFGLHINWDGTVVADPAWDVWNSAALTNLVSTAHAAGTKVVLTIDLQDFQPGTPNMCAGLINRAVTVKQAAAQVAAKGVDGVNVDYEGLNGTCQNGATSQSMLTDFVRQLRAALQAGSYLSIDTYAGAAADTLGFFDVGGLNSYVDSFFVMAYDLEYSNYWRSPLGCVRFCLGPTAPLSGYYYNDTSTADQYVAAVPASKVILGVPYYGRKSCVSAAAPNQQPTSGVVADSYLDASTESGAAGVGAGSYAMHRDANDPAGQERWDTWFNTSLGCTRELYWDDTVSLGAKYDLVNRDGLRGVGIWTLNYGGSSPELWSALSIHFSAACSVVSVTVTPVSPAGVGAKVTLTAHASGCPNPLYHFSVLAPGATTYQMVQDYSTSPSLTWNTTGLAPGAYRFSVWARDAASSGVYGNSSGRWDAYDNNAVYSLTASCSAVGVSGAPSSPVGAGGTVTLTAHASGCSNPLYHFSVLAPGATTYQMVQDYSTSPSLTWNTTGLAPGAYRFSVWARDAASSGVYGNSSGRWDAYDNDTVYSLTASCSAVGVSGAPSSPVGAGVAVTLTAHASGCSNPLYHFDVLAPGATTYQMVQDYSTSPSLTWNTTGLAPGGYRFSVWARDAASSGVYGNSSGRWDAYDNNTVYTLATVCGAVSVTVSPPSPSSVGAVVTVTAHATGCPDPVYHFGVLAPGATTYQMVQDYSTSPSLTWNTTGLAPGIYRFSVWARDAASSGTYGNSSGRWDAYDNNTLYTMTPVCAAVSVSVSPTSPSKVGTGVIVTARATGCANPLYHFSVLAPGATSYTVVQGYSSSASFTWNTTGLAPGTYRFSVWATDAASSGVYGNSVGRWDAYNNDTVFVLS